MAVMTAVNDDGGLINVARDESGEDSISRTMQKYKARAEPWMLVVDDNCACLFYSDLSVSPFGAPDLEGV